jgi:hypothetical protein
MLQNMQEVMDSMVETEYWYEESGSRADGRGKNKGPRQSKKWWLPTPRVPEIGLSQSQRKRLVFQAKLILQILKAAKSINEQVIFQMPIAEAVMNALPKASTQSRLHNLKKFAVNLLLCLRSFLIQYNILLCFSVWEG